MADSAKSPQRKRGHAIIEVSLLAPWIFFLFVGILDFGFYAYAAIATENAVRVAVHQTSQDINTASRSDLACTYVLAELKSTPNMKSVNTCAADEASIDSSQPVAVAAVQVNGVDGTLASQVTVSYETIQMIPIPGLLAGKIRLTRVAQMRLRDQ